MNSCPLCGESLPGDRPRHRVNIEIEDTTRSATQFNDSETEVSRYCVDRQVCHDCWDDLRKRLS